MPLNHTAVNQLTVKINKHKQRAAIKSKRPTQANLVLVNQTV